MSRIFKDASVDSLFSSSLCKLPTEIVSVGSYPEPFPIKGAIAYDTATDSIYYADGSIWLPISTGTTVVNLGGDVTGLSNNNTVIRIRNQPIAAGTVDGQIWEYNLGTNSWVLNTLSVTPSTGNLLMWSGTRWVPMGGTPTAGQVPTALTSSTFSWQTPAGGGIAGVTLQEEGVTVGTAAGITQVNFVGTGVTATAVGTNATVTIPSGIAGFTVQEEGVTVGTAAGITSVNFVGTGATATAVGANATITIPAGIAGLTLQEEGVTVGTAAGITQLNFVGAGVTATGAGANGTVTIPVGGGGGSLGFAHFYGLAPGDYAATIGIGAPMDFPNLGATGGSTPPTRASATNFDLPAIGTYEVYFQVSIAEPGQLMLTLNAGLLTYSVAGRATGTSQISNKVYITTVAPNAVLQIINPAGNAAALTVTPTAGGTHAVSATLTILRIA